jgi:hypothetical protein
MIVVATSSSTDEHSDLSWLLEYLSDYCIRVYDNLDAGSAQHDGSRPFTVTLVLRPQFKTQARTRGVFVSADHFENLPSRTVFLHGHRSSWHSPIDMAVLLRYLRWDLDYASLNFGGRVRDGPALVNGVETDYQLINRAWPTVFEVRWGREH